MVKKTLISLAVGAAIILPSLASAKLATDVVAPEFRTAWCLRQNGTLVPYSVVRPNSLGVAQTLTFRASEQVAFCSAAGL
jgi:hypothetical protein